MIEYRISQPRAKDHRIIDDWAEQFVQLTNTPVAQQVEDSSAFLLSPW